MRIFLLVIGIFSACIGVKMCFDARELTKKLFSFGDQNTGTKAFKTFGYIFSLIGSLLLYYNL